ncbi:hypothetical protein K1719_028958 [Acacia pycnantha]|nr:hypothetical protein K1719_028958 [Acacia pycnantha]
MWISLFQACNIGNVLPNPRCNNLPINIIRIKAHHRTLEQARVRGTYIIAHFAIAPVIALPCGHYMHSACFQAYTCSHYACPICSKSLGDMAIHSWRMWEDVAQVD